MRLEALERASAEALAGLEQLIEEQHIEVCLLPFDRDCKHGTPCTRKVWDLWHKAETDMAIAHEIAAAGASTWRQRGLQIANIQGC